MLYISVLMIKKASPVVYMVFVHFNSHGRKQTYWQRKQNIWFFATKMDVKLSVTKIKPN